MNNFSLTSGSVSFEVDLSVYNAVVIAKVLYWFTNDYIISESESAGVRRIVIEAKEGKITESTAKEIQEKLNRDFQDYRLRDIVNRETEHVRNILYIKAFAHGEEFDDFKLLSQE